jgi:FtsP/CotA-like multicopper oxidase with cupredoxin domain
MGKGLKVNMKYVNCALSVVVLILVVICYFKKPMEGFADWELKKPGAFCIPDSKNLDSNIGEYEAYVGSDGLSPKDTTKQLCLKTPGCVGFTYRKKDNKYLFKNKITGTTKNKNYVCHKRNIRGDINVIQGIIDLWTKIPKSDIFIKINSITDPDSNDKKISCNISSSEKEGVKVIWTQPVSNLPLIILQNHINYNYKLCFINEDYMYKHYDGTTHGTNIHFHNLQTDSYSDGSNMEQVMVPTKQDTRTPKINSFRPSLNLKGENSERTIIYHTHKHGLSAQIAANGCYGVAIIAPNPKISATGFKPSIINTYDYIIAIGGSNYSPTINFKSAVHGKNFTNNDIQIIGGKDIVLRFRVVCAFSGYSDFGRIKLIGDQHETYIIADESGLLNMASYARYDKENHMIITSGNRYEFMTKINGDTRIMLETHSDDKFPKGNQKMFQIYNLRTFSDAGGLPDLIQTKYSEYTDFFNNISSNNLSIRESLGHPQSAYNFGGQHPRTHPKIEKTRQVIYTGGMNMLWDVLREEHHVDVGGTLNDGDTESNVFKCKHYGGHSHHDTNKFTITYNNKDYNIELAPNDNLSGKLYSVNNFVNEINRQIKAFNIPLFLTIHILSLGPDDFKNNSYFDNGSQTSAKKEKTHDLYLDDDDFEFNVFSCKWHCGSTRDGTGFGYEGAPKNWNIKIDAKNKYMARMIGIMTLQSNFSDKNQIEYHYGDPIVDDTSITFKVDKGRTARTAKILGQIFSHGFINVNQILDTKSVSWEKWIVRNISGEAHNFHHHLFQSKIIIDESSEWHARNYTACGLSPQYHAFEISNYLPHLQASKDTWAIPNGTFFSILCPIEYIKYQYYNIKNKFNKDIAEYNKHLPYMAHCHFLPHEDMGMMSSFMVTEK